MEFEENYSTLVLKNQLPEIFNLEEYSLVQAIDFTNIDSITFTLNISFSNFLEERAIKIAPTIIIKNLIFECFFSIESSL